MTKSGYIESNEPVEKKNSMRLTRWEMETVINYNAEEKTARLYTRDKAVMRKLDKLVAKCPDTYKLVEETEIDKTYEFPKRLIGYRAPRVLTDEQREETAKRLAKAREQQRENDEMDEEFEYDDLEDDLEEKE